MHQIHAGRKFILMISLMILGIALSVQVRSTLHINRQKLTVDKMIEKYQSQLDAERRNSARLKELIKQNEKEKETHLEKFATEQNDSFFSQKKAYLDELNLIAGLVAVKGTGITITLMDAKQREPGMSEEDLKFLLIHDSDVIGVMNELKKAGAQAMSINDERIIATSAQVCAGPTILVNKTRFAVPFIIKAIGDPDALYAGVDSSQIVKLLRKSKITVDITISEELNIPKYSADDENTGKGVEVTGR